MERRQKSSKSSTLLRDPYYVCIRFYVPEIRPNYYDYVRLTFPKACADSYSGLLQGLYSSGAAEDLNSAREDQKQPQTLPQTLNPKPEPPNP